MTIMLIEMLIGTFGLSRRRSNFLVGLELFGRPPSTSDQVRGRLFANHAPATVEKLAECLLQEHRLWHYF
jgi:hypothetical protein